MTQHLNNSVDILDRLTKAFADSPVQQSELEKTFYMFAATALVDRISLEKVALPSTQINKLGHGKGFEGSWQSWLGYWEEKFASDRAGGYCNFEPVEDYFAVLGDESLALTPKAIIFIRERLQEFPECRAL